MPSSGVRGWGLGSTRLHDQRLDAVADRLLDVDTESVLDLGCGSGALLERLLLEPRLRRILGVDSSSLALAAAEARLTMGDGSRDERLSLRQGSVTEIRSDLGGFGAVALVETFEHVRPSHLSRLERGIFIHLRPARVVITTPNREYNPVYGLEPDEYRHPHHRFEWDRAKFQRWASGAAGRNGYEVAFEGIGPAHAWFGSPTQMAVFRRGAPARGG